MVKIQRILCPTDFSEFGEQALSYGCELAQVFGAELHLLHVLQDYEGVAPASGEVFAPFVDWLPELREKAEAKLNELPGEKFASLKVCRATRVGPPIDEIVKYAKENQIDMIIQGTHGRRGVKHLLLGSVAENIVRYSPCPVLTVRNLG